MKYARERGSTPRQGVIFLFLFRGICIYLACITGLRGGKSDITSSTNHSTMPEKDELESDYGDAEEFDSDEGDPNAFRVR